MISIRLSRRALALEVASFFWRPYALLVEFVVFLDRVRGFFWNNRELKVHFLHFFETIAKSEFIISGVRVNSRTFWNSDFIFGTFPKQLRSQSSFSDLGGTWSSDNRNSAKLRV